MVRSPHRPSLPALSFVSLSVVSLSSILLSFAALWFSGCDTGCPAGTRMVGELCQRIAPITEGGAGTDGSVYPVGAAGFGGGPPGFTAGASGTSVSAGSSGAGLGGVGAAGATGFAGAAGFSGLAGMSGGAGTGAAGSAGLDPYLMWLCMKNQAGQCLTCKADSECPRQTCGQGICLECRETKHCGSGDVCVTNRCVPASSTHDTDAGS
ncbi:MAG: hypothetical protein RL701_1491 [Pseudomonadota bacterium]